MDDEASDEEPTSKGKEVRMTTNKVGSDRFLLSGIHTLQ